MKETRRKSVRLLSLLLAMLMLVSIVPAVSAADATGDGGVVLNKTATLENDGTYTIDLSGYVTGEATTITETTQIPLDVILVLDASSSMTRFNQTADTYHDATAVGWTDAGGKAAETYPAGTTAEDNLWEKFTHLSKVYFSNSGDFRTNGATKGSILIPVKPGDKIYCSSFKAEATTGGSMDGIRVAYFGADGSLLKNGNVDPADVYAEFTKNDGKYIVVPNGAAAMTVGLWGNDKESVIQNLSLGTRRYYNPSNDREFSTMYVKMLQEQVESFAQTLATNAESSGQTHNLAIVTFGGGNTGKEDQNSEQGHYDKHVSVNGYNNYFFTNTGLFVNGQFKNFLTEEKADGKSRYAYNPIYAADLVDGRTYYYLTWGKDSDGGTGDSDGRVGDVNPVTYNASTGKGTAKEDGKTVTLTPRVSPYDSDNNTLFLERTSVAANQLTAQDYKEALANVNNGGQISADIRFATDRIVARGGTDTKFGLEMAANILAQNPARTYTDVAGNDHKSQQIVILFTDGDTDNQESGTYASIFNHANAIKNAGATVYTISVGTEANKKWMDQISSNFGTGNYNDSRNFSGGKYFTNIEDMSGLEAIFKEITGSLTTSDTSVKLDDTAVMQDVLGDGFVLPADFGFSNISVSTVAVTTTDDTNYVDGAETKFTYDAASGTYKNGSETLTVTIDKATGKVSVTGFNYAENHVTTAHPGKKLVVKITGVEVTKNTVTDAVIATNKDSSGIAYTTEGGTAGLYPFEVPKTKLTSKTYVVDYAKPMTIKPSDWSATMNGMVSVDRLNAGQFKDAITTDYGKFEKGADGEITFTPLTMQWDDAATIYAFGTWGAGKDNSITTGNNLWTKVNVIPANNIYYEDDFTTVTSSGRVGIEYNSDGNGSWETEGTAGGNTENHEGAENGEGVHGWVDSLADDNAYSDGSAHVGQVPDNNSHATATFTFTGRGVDIYSRTNNETGTVRATLKGVDVKDDAGNPITIAMGIIVDSISESGDYYQIPTLSFMTYKDSAGNEQPLPHGTYEVKISVTTAAKDRFIYYLDGIRIYNPMKDDSAYAPEEQNAIFTEVRDLLAKSDNTAQGKSAVFIDKTGESQDGDADTIGVVKNYDETEYGQLGPKNEVYLANGQAITFKVESEGQFFYVGLKAPNINGEGENSGTATALVSNGDANKEIAINHSTDLYYKLNPDADGYITIKNIGEGLLSITKIRTTGDTEQGIQLVSITAEEALEAVRVFAERSEVSNEEEPVDPENPTEPEIPDVEIENPTEPETPEENRHPVWNPFGSLLVKIIKSFFGWFH